MRAYTHIHITSEYRISVHITRFGTDDTIQQDGLWSSTQVGYIFIRLYVDDLSMIWFDQFIVAQTLYECHAGLSGERVQ